MMGQLDEISGVIKNVQNMVGDWWDSSMVEATLQDSGLSKQEQKYVLDQTTALNPVKERTPKKLEIMFEGAQAPSASVRLPQVRRPAVRRPTP